MVKLRCLIVFVSTIYATYGNQNIQNFHQNIQHKFKNCTSYIPRELIENMGMSLDGEDIGRISADISAYADKVIYKINNLIVRNGLDPLELLNATLESVLSGDMNLSHGRSQNLSTLSRNGDIVISYNSSTKILTVNLPIKFDDQFSYDGHTNITLLSIKEAREGKTKTIQIRVLLKDCFHVNQTHIDLFKVGNPGIFSIAFIVNSLLDWIKSTITTEVIKYLRRIISHALNTLIKGFTDNAVIIFNKIKDSIRHR